MLNSSEIRLTGLFNNMFGLKNKFETDFSTAMKTHGNENDACAAGESLKICLQTIYRVTADSCTPKSRQSCVKREAKEPKL